MLLIIKIVVHCNSYPMQAAAGPALADNVPPTAQPDKTGFQTSCLALCFSMIHSTPLRNSCYVYY